MRAVVLDGPGPADVLKVRELPVPQARPGWVLIRVEAFGLNRSELHLRQGIAEGATFPRVPGIEAAGTVVADPSGAFAAGQQVMAMMGGMGRAFDGGYAEYTLVPPAQLVPFTSDLPWSVLGAVPEMLQTAYGSLTVGLDLQAGQSLLVRGATSSVGAAAVVLAHRAGATVLATTRDATKESDLLGLGADHVLVDRGAVQQAVRDLVPGGVHAVLELVGATTLADSLAATRYHGTVCFTGMLGGQWLLPDFYPNDDLPRGVRLSGYHGDAGDLPAPVLQSFLDDVVAGVTVVPVHRVFALDEIVEAHELMETSHVVGKLVVVTRP